MARGNPSLLSYFLLNLIDRLLCKCLNKYIQGEY
nr:MAG TPA: hypothetical protein [Caudoviricetes sp.]